MAGTTPDGDLSDWADVTSAEKWQVLLLGNGLSINVWPPFGYSRLLEHAANSADLTDTDRALFRDTPNFELALSDLSTAIRVAETVGTDARRMYRHYSSIQKALGKAVRQVHVARTQVPNKTLSTIRGVLEDYEWIFTTSYDLLVYWAMGYGGRYAPFKDHFRYGGRCEFDPDRASVFAGEIPVYYLHGALHLVVGGNGATWKLRQTSLQTILDQFGTPRAGDSRARPLLVTEGSSEGKLRAIEANGYLTHALDRLRERDQPLVVFGSSLGTQDAHLVEALSERPERPIAVSMRPTGTKRERAARQVDLWGRLGIDDLYFFDATTHPLGAPDLAAPLP